MSDYPYAGSFVDRHGKKRWRFRRASKTTPLPGQPGEPEFEAAYAAALAGRKIDKAQVVRHPSAAGPRTLAAAWRILRSDSPEWRALGPVTQRAQSLIIERFLLSPVVEGEPTPFGSVAVADLKRKHVKAILARKYDTPHAAAYLLRLLRKLIGVALEQEWIDSDPTYRLTYRPPYKGWKAWPDEARQRYEARWPIGSTPRLVYALALYFGHRRSDVTAVKWVDLVEGGTNAVQQKTGKALWIPMHSELLACLEATPRLGEHVVLTRSRRPFSAKALGMRMQNWTAAAGLPPGHTLHGLRKALGKMLAEAGATTRELMAVLGHDDINHAELYSREAEQRSLAEAGMKKLSRRP